MFFWSLLLFLWSNGCWWFDLWFSAFSKSSLNIWKVSVHVLLKPCLENFEHYFASVWEACSYVVVWTFFGITFLYCTSRFQNFSACWNSINIQVLFFWTLFLWLEFYSVFNCLFLWAFGASQVELVAKNTPANAGDIRNVGLIPVSGRSPRRGRGNLFQYSCLENPHGQRSPMVYSP